MCMHVCGGVLTTMALLKMFISDLCHSGHPVPVMKPLMFDFRALLFFLPASV